MGQTQQTTQPDKPKIDKEAIKAIKQENDKKKTALDKGKIITK